MRIIAIILAAGKSERFGNNKLLEPIADLPMIRRVASAVEDAAPDAVVLVAGRDALDVHAAAGVDFLVINDNYANGIGSSIAAAVNSVKHAADALIVCLGDQPLIPAAHYAALIDSWTGDPQAILVTGYGQGAEGPPVLFGSGHFGRLGNLDGDQGAKLLFSSGTVQVIDCESAALDVDTVADMAEAGTQAR